MKCIQRIPEDVCRFFDQEAEDDREEYDTDDDEEHELGK